MIVGKIRTGKIDKTKLYTNPKDGAVWLDIVLIETPNSQHGDDYMIVQGLSKEERAAGKKGAILGNARILGQNKPQPKPQTRPAPTNPPPADDDPAF